MQFKDALAVDDARGVPRPHAALDRPRPRRRPRDPPLVRRARRRRRPRRLPGVTRALIDTGYAGWIVFESDQSPHPATSTLLGGYLMQEQLRPMFAAMPWSRERVHGKSPMHPSPVTGGRPDCAGDVLPRPEGW